MRRFVFGSVVTLSAWSAVTAHADAVGIFHTPPVVQRWLVEQVRTFQETARVSLGLSPTTFHNLLVYLWFSFWLIATLYLWRFQKVSSRDSEEMQAFKKTSKFISFLFLLDSILSISGI